MPETAPDTTADTLAYYDQHAQAFSDSTAHVDLSAMHARFEALLEPGATVLDFGCGSGRDTKHFLDAGFHVVAVDGSEELCKLAERLTGAPVRRMLFQDLDEVGAYDGIWACSSILHLPKPELADVFARMAAALRHGGVLYTSFKHGDFEGMRNGRWFTDFTEPAFREFVGAFPDLGVEQAWISGDVRPGRGDERWLNLLLRKA